MKYLIMNFLALAAAWCFAPTAHSQAFGIEMGQDPSTIAGAREVEDQEPGPLRSYQLTNPPQSHSEFEAYLVLATPQHGVCKVVGIGKNHTPDQYGHDVRRSFTALKSALTSKYGSATEFDFLHSGSIWDDRDDFAMSLKQGERSLSLYFDSESGSRLPVDIETIALKAYGLGADTTFLKLAYEFANFGSCVELQNNADNDAL